VLPLDWLFDPPRLMIIPWTWEKTKQLQYADVYTILGKLTRASFINLACMMEAMYIHICEGKNVHCPDLACHRNLYLRCGQLFMSSCCV
jgi:hypothetical protein